MKKIINIKNILLTSVLTALVYFGCKKEEIVIVYSKINTVITSNITSTTTDVEGNIEELTTATHSEYGFCWDTIKDPTIYMQKSVLNGTPKTGSFKVTITGLNPSKTYHVRAFVKDNKKYVYGLDLSFTTTAPILSTVSTISVSGITSKYAISGGNVTSEGDKPVIAKGVCYDTVSSPTILKNKTMDGWGTGSYTSNLLDLLPSKTYYVKAYAISEFGISYGDEVTFTTNTKLYSFHEEFSDNTNDWYIVADTTSSFAVTGGEYVCTYHNPGYLTWTYLNFPDFITVANNKDFEVNTSINISSFQDIVTPNSDMTAGLLLDVSNTNFMYFGIKKHIGSSITDAPAYYYEIGSYNGTWTKWKDFTLFTGSVTNKLTIKKGSGYYYFFVNDIQVHKQAYTNIANDGVGFYIMDATLHADSLYIDQKGEKKSAGIDLIKLIPGSKGQQNYIKSHGK